MMDIKPRAGTMDENVIHEMEGDIYGIRSVLRPGDVIIDVGAYIGTFSLFALGVCPEVKIIALEPMPANFEELQKNVPSSVTIEQAAMAGTPGTVTIYDFGRDASACHSIYNLGVTEAMPVTARGETLTNVFEKHQLDRVRFLKLDCQGAEYDILPQTNHAVLRRIDYIGMEMHKQIAKIDHTIGEIPDHFRKRRVLLAHLLKTHLPVAGNIYSQSMHTWKNRNLLSKAAQAALSLRRVTWPSIIDYMARQLTWRRRQLRTLLRRP